MTNFVPTYPDYSVFPKQLPSPEADLGEVAARLGSLSTQRRTGRIVFQDSFLSKNGWLSVPVLGQIEISSLFTWYSETVLQILPDNNGNMSYVQKGFSTGIDTFGVEISIAPMPFTPWSEYSDIYLSYDTGSEKTIYDVRVYWNLHIVTAKGLTIINFPPPWSGKYTWHNLKFTVDLTNRKFGWIYFDDFSYNGSAIDGFDNTPDGDNAFIIIGAVNDPPSSGGVLYDNLIVSTNEVVT